MRGFRLFERPVGAFATFPPLQVVGTLPFYEAGEPYEGRLDILGAVGRCHVEIVEEDTHLPPGSYAYVDNFNQNVVLKWPAYRPPAPSDDEIINPDFQEGMEGWVDLQGNSWSVRKYEDDDTNVGPGDRPRPPGNLAAWMTGAGRGDHILESIPYPVEPGQYITARALWDQGPSNKDNNNLFTALGLYRDGQFIEQVLGDRIHDRTNRTRHWSHVDHLIQPGIDAVTVRLIAHRRNGRNREIIVDNVETGGLSYSLGTNVDEEYRVKFKVTDSANRVAYWSGIVTEYYIYFTSPLYPVELDDALTVYRGDVLGASAKEMPAIDEWWEQWAPSGDIAGVSLRLPLVGINASPEYWATSGDISQIAVRNTLVHTEVQPEAWEITTGEVLGISTRVALVAVANEPESRETSATITGITLHD